MNTGWCHYKWVHFFWPVVWTGLRLVHKSASVQHFLSPVLYCSFNVMQALAAQVHQVGSSWLKMLPSSSWITTSPWLSWRRLLLLSFLPTGALPQSTGLSMDNYSCESFGTATAIPSAYGRRKQAELLGDSDETLIEGGNGRIIDSLAQSLSGQIFQYASNADSVPVVAFVWPFGDDTTITSLSPSLTVLRDVKIQVDLPKRLRRFINASARMKSYMLDLSRKSGDGKWVCSRGLDRSGIRSLGWNPTTG